MVGGLGSLIVTTDDSVCIVAPGLHSPAPQITSCSSWVVPAGVGNVSDWVRRSKSVVEQYWPLGIPTTVLALGSALMLTPQ
jgi:hypothetical protein